MAFPIGLIAIYSDSTNFGGVRNDRILPVAYREAEEDVLYVVYTERRDSIRIISARIATHRERRMYYAGI